MPADTKLTEQLLTRLIALHEKGASAREIAENLGVSKTTVGRWMAERGLIPKGKPGPHRAPVKAAAKASPVAPVGVPELAQNVAKAEASLNGPGASEGVIRRRLAEIVTLLDVQKKKIEEGTGSIIAYKHFTELERTYARELHALAPPPESDPEKDPTNRAAAMRVSDRIAELVSDAEREVVCMHCGEHPFR